MQGFQCSWIVLRLHADAESVDVAARGFCRQATTGNSTIVTGEDLMELKKALQDLEGT